MMKEMIILNLETLFLSVLCVGKKRIHHDLKTLGHFMMSVVECAHLVWGRGIDFSLRC